MVTGFLAFLIHSGSVTANFKLSSLFLVTTLAAIAAAVFAANFGLGVLFLIVAVPALALTIMVLNGARPTAR